MNDRATDGSNNVSRSERLNATRNIDNADKEAGEKQKLPFQ